MGPQFFTGVVERFVYVTSTAISNRKSTIDEGFFGFFFCLGEKKKRPAGKAIRKRIITRMLRFLTITNTIEINYE